MVIQKSGHRIPLVDSSTKLLFSNFMLVDAEQLCILFSHGATYLTHNNNHSRNIPTWSFNVRVILNHLLNIEHICFKISSGTIPSWLSGGFNLLHGWKIFMRHNSFLYYLYVELYKVNGNMRPFSKSFVNIKNCFIIKILNWIC